MSRRPFRRNSKSASFPENPLHFIEKKTTKKTLLITSLCSAVFIISLAGGSSNLHCCRSSPQIPLNIACICFYMSSWGYNIFKVLICVLQSLRQHSLAIWNFQSSHFTSASEQWLRVIQSTIGFCMLDNILISSLRETNKLWPLHAHTNR